MWRERIDDELRQAAEEGFDVSALRERVRDELPPDEAAYHLVVRELADCRRRPDFEYDEPSLWEEILGCLDELEPARPVAADLEWRLEGAWRGRAVGCMMGCPCEGWNAGRIRAALSAADAYPLTDYFPAAAAEDRLHYGKPIVRYCREHLDRVRADDDLAYPILGLLLLEKHGNGVASRHVGEAWLEHLPREFVFTAEGVAHDNLRQGLEPPATAHHLNPYREWIGAQIRADIWGYVSAGDPLLAADLAFRDASVSHVKNGIYGALFFAAAMARAFTTADPFEAIESGLRVVPPQSRLAQAVVETVRWAEEDSHWEATLHRIVARFGRYHWVHVIPNALVTLMALVHGRGSFLDTVSIAVMAGFDTDCNGATAGSLAGILYGADAIPERLARPLGDRVETYLQGHERQSLQDLVRRTAVVARTIRG
jgi:ADP-ribosylglycohydrolase